MNTFFKYIFLFILVTYTVPLTAKSIIIHGKVTYQDREDKEDKPANGVFISISDPQLPHSKRTGADGKFKIVINLGFPEFKKMEPLLDVDQKISFSVIYKGLASKNNGHEIRIDSPREGVAIISYKHPITIKLVPKSYYAALAAENAKTIAYLKDTETRVGSFDGAVSTIALLEKTSKNQVLDTILESASIASSMPKYNKNSDYAEEIITNKLASIPSFQYKAVTRLKGLQGTVNDLSNGSTETAVGLISASSTNPWNTKAQVIDSYRADVNAILKRTPTKKNRQIYNYAESVKPELEMLSHKFRNREDLM